MFKRQGEILHNPWFRFTDARGTAMCSPDILQVRQKAIILIECKLSFTQTGVDTLIYKYAPVVEFYYKRPVISLLVSKNIGKGWNKLAAVEWEDVDELPVNRKPFWLHHLG